ncbi:hypothetical protein G6F37_012182 [Rhizopus arrhizus]|nr:hypothetical protein G6F38_012137 [Rhizopus arrhizus]KAG1145198.1 hypothetical protein G6F37_012182 [Rhizopus arrhizus]
MFFINISTANYSNPAGIRRQRPVTLPTNPIIIVDSDEVEEMRLETEQISNLDEAFISTNNDDNEELLEIEDFEFDEELHDDNILPDDWSREQNVPIIFFINNGIYYGSNTVYRCNGAEGSIMYLERTGSIPRWRCNGIIINQETGEKCCNGRQITVRNASFFAHRNLPSYDTLSILYFWSLKICRMTISTMVGCSSNTQNDCKIGGYDADVNPIVVEIDESNLEKESIIVGTVWRMFECVTFRDGDVHTNTIEGTWNGIKMNVTPVLRTKKMVPWLLIEFIWRRKHHNDIFGGIVNCLKNVSFDRAQRNPACLTELAAE